MKEVFRPCPFCGGEAKTISNTGDYRESNMYAVVCKGCGVRTALINDRQMASLLWNRRIDD